MATPLVNVQLLISTFESAVKNMNPPVSFDVSELVSESVSVLVKLHIVIFVYEKATYIDEVCKEDTLSSKVVLYTVILVRMVFTVPPIVELL